MATRTYRPVPGIPFSWESQWSQYPAEHDPGFRHTVEFIEGHPDNPIDCLLLYSEERQLVGILNRYANGFPGFEEPMAINIWIEPGHQRQGLGTRLLAEAERRWGPVDWDAQRVTEAGFRFAEAYRDAQERDRA